MEPKSLSMSDRRDCEWQISIIAAARRRRNPNGDTIHWRPYTPLRICGVPIGADWHPAVKGVSFLSIIEVDCRSCAASAPTHNDRTDNLSKFCPSRAGFQTAARLLYGVGHQSSQGVQECDCARPHRRPRNRRGVLKNALDLIRPLERRARPA